MESSVGSSVDGRVGTPAATAAALAEILSPMDEMTSGVGPIQVRPASATAVAKAAFSARKP